MKNLILLSTCLFFAILFAAAQPDGDRGDKIKSIKIAFITEKLNLTVSEAEAFWPLYNEFDEAMQESRRSMKAKHGKRGELDFDNVSNEKALELLTDRQKHDAEIVELKKEYTEKFLAVLPATKVLKLFHAEEAFKRELLRSMRSKGGDRERGPR